MKIISFAWTTAALVAYRKTVTRRDIFGTGKYYEQFEAGDVLMAYNRSPRFKGTKVGYIVLMEKPYKENLNQMPFEDYEGEGFGWFDENPDKIPKYWQKTFAELGLSNFKEYFLRLKLISEERWVIRFEFYEQLSEIPLVIYNAKRHPLIWHREV